MLLVQYAFNKLQPTFLNYFKATILTCKTNLKYVYFFDYNIVKYSD